MTQGTRRPNQMEFKARSNIAGECLDIFQYKILWSNIKILKLRLDFRLKSKINVQIS